MSQANFESSVEQYLAILKPKVVLSIAAASDACIVLLADGTVFDFGGKGATPRFVFENLHLDLLERPGPKHN